MLPYSRDIVFIGTVCVFYSVTCHSTRCSEHLQTNKAQSYLRPFNVNETQLKHTKIKKDRDENVFHLNETNKNVFMDIAQGPESGDSRKDVKKKEHYKMYESLFKNKSEVYTLSNNKTNSSGVTNDQAGIASNEGLIRGQGKVRQPLRYSNMTERTVFTAAPDGREMYKTNDESGTNGGSSTQKNHTSQRGKDIENNNNTIKGFTDVNKGRKTEGEGFLDLVKSSPMLLISQLIMLGFSPVILANLKMMVMNSLMLNNMALSSALFMTLRNMVFGTTKGSKVKYHNYGYQKHHSSGGNLRRRYYVIG